jgi:hypothetical protein
MQSTTVQALGQGRLAELHRQAQRDSLARAAGRRHPARHLLAALTGRARRPR